ncbi:MAG: TetR/AcrR family transcriptional regulator [Candidatus Thorarchaeota archaeon]
MPQILKKEKKEKIECAALNEFLSKGFLNASMRTIAQNAQTSTSNLYNYFDSKEKLFYSITNNVYNNISNLASDLVQTESEFGREYFFEQVSNLIAQPIKELLKNHRKEFLLIMEGSQGTKYENFQEELVIIMEKHFAGHLQTIENIPTKERTDTFIFHILARNLLEGLLEISRHYINDKWAGENIEALMKYHVHGMTQFFK